MRTAEIQAREVAIITDDGERIGTVRPFTMYEVYDNSGVYYGSMTYGSMMDFFEKQEKSRQEGIKG